MELILIIVVIIVGILTIRAIKLNGENNRKALVMASPDYQSKLRTLRDMINFKNEHVSYTESIHRYEAELNSSSNLKMRTELKKEIKEAKSERKILTEAFHEKYQNDPYNPMKIPFEEFPDELLQQWEAIELRLDAIRHTEY